MLRVCSLVALLLSAQSVAALITFVVSPMNTSVLQDGSVVLRCLVASDGTLVRISWLKDGNVIPADRFHFDTQSGILSLLLVQCADAGWYSCVVTDGSETAEKRAYLTVLCGTVPSFVRELPPKYTLTNVQSQGEAAVVQCYAKGNPPPVVRWEKGRQRLPSSPSTKGPYATGGTLHLVSSLPGDSGEYCCVAENKLGTAVKCTTVNIVEETPPLWLSWWMLSLYCVVVILVLLGVPLCCRLAVEGCRRRTEEEELADLQNRSPWGVTNPGATPAVVLTGTRESFFHEGEELGMFTNGDQTPFRIQPEEMKRGLDEAVGEQITSGVDSGDTGGMKERVCEVLDERVMKEERVGVKEGETVTEEREERERREGMDVRVLAGRREEIQEGTVLADKVMECRENDGVHTDVKEDRVKIEKSLHRRSQVESQVYEFTFDQCDSDATQDSEGSVDMKKMLS